MKRSIVLGLVAVMGLMWGCDETTDDCPNCPPFVKGVDAKALPGLWAGRMVHYIDDTTSEVGELYVAFTESTFVTWPPSYPDSLCPPLIGFGRWSTNGFHIAMQNDSGKTFGCDYTPFDTDTLRGFNENDSLYILDAPFFGGPFNDPILYRDSVVLVRVPFLDSIIAGGASPISREDLMGTWTGRYIHHYPHYPNTEGNYPVEFIVTDSDFTLTPDSSWGYCPPLYAMGPWDLHGYIFYRQNWSVYLAICSYFPFAFFQSPVWLEGDTLVMLENLQWQPADIRYPEYLDTMRVVKVQ